MTVAEVPTRLAFCTRCGRSAPIIREGLDPRYPIVHCSRVDPQGDETGCGDRPAMFDQEAAQELIEQRRAIRITKRHDEHVRGKKRNALCLQCAIDPPPDRATIHRYVPIAGKFRIASHLEFSHADRAMLPRLALRPESELILHHRKLHDDALARR